MSDENQNEIRELILNATCNNKYFDSSDRNTSRSFTDSELESLNQLIKNRKEGSLDFSSLRINDDICSSLFKILNESPNIKSLNLDDNKIGSGGAMAISENKTLKELEMRDNLLGDRGLEYLLKLDNEELSVAKNGLTVEGLAHLFQSDRLKTLKGLDISGNNIGKEGLKALFELINPEEMSKLILEELYIAATGTDAKALEALFELKTLKSLEVSDNDMSGGEDNLLKLNLDKLFAVETKMNAKALEALLNSNTIKELNIAYNNEDNEPLEATPGDKLEKLNASFTGMSDKGAEALANSQTLKELKLEGNYDITKNGYNALLKSTSLISLELSPSAEELFELQSEVDNMLAHNARLASEENKKERQEIFQVILEKVIDSIEETTGQNLNDKNKPEARDIAVGVEQFFKPAEVFRSHLNNVVKTREQREKFAEIVRPSSSGKDNEPSAEKPRGI